MQVRIKVKKKLAKVIDKRRWNSKMHQLVGQTMNGILETCHTDENDNPEIRVRVDCSWSIPINCVKLLKSEP